MKTEFPLSSAGTHIDPRRIPPGQTIADKFPVLTYGDVPKIEMSDWRLDVWGLVEEPVSFTWNEFMKLPRTSLKADFHCVTAWSRFDDVWEGVPARHSAVTARRRALQRLRGIREDQACSQVCHAACLWRLHDKSSSESDARGRCHVRSHFERRTAAERPRRSDAGHHAATVRVEGSEMDPWSGVHVGKPIGFLGAQRVQQFRRPVEGRKILSGLT
jgi:hypothetical protein